MKKLITTLLLFLIYSPGFAQVPAKVEEDLTAIEQRLESIRNYYTPAMPTGLQAETEAGAILVTWQPFSRDTADIRYMSPQLHSRWLTVNQYFRFHQTPVEPEAGQYKIGLSVDDASQYTWRVQFVIPGVWESEVVDVEARPDPEPLPADTTKLDRYILHSFWDYVSPEVFPYVNTVKIDIDQVADVPVGVQIVPYIGFNKSSDRWESRLRNKLQNLEGIDPARVSMVVLQDEPISKGWSREQMEALVDLARATDSRFSYTFSFTRTHTERRTDSEYPQNIDVAIINYYPFYLKDLSEQYDYYKWVGSKEEFLADFQSVLDAARAKAPEVDRWYITGQSFWKVGGSLLWMKWRQPPVEAPFWYLEAVVNNPDVAGLFWYVFGEERHPHPGAKDYPEYLESIEAVFEEIPEE